MELSRQEYPALLDSLQPTQAVAILEERVKLIGRVNADIADHLSSTQERRRVEEAYVQGLKKLLARQPQNVSTEFGVFQAPWQSIVKSTETLAQSHSTFAQRLEADVERPLRDYQSKSREMQAMSTIQGNLVAISREVETSQKRAEKVKGGRSGANKVAAASSDYIIANQHWNVQAPYVFEQLQALDESRVNHLRDVLTQLETHEVDRIERNRISAETCLNVILNLNTADEISAFVARSSSGTPMVPARLTSRPPTSHTLLAPTQSRGGDDGASERSASSGGALRLGAGSGSRSGTGTGAGQEKRSGFGGLRRLGTVMSRKQKDPKPAQSTSSPEKRSRPNRNPLRRGPSSRDMQTIPSPEESVVHLPPPPRRQEPALSSPTKAPVEPPQPQPETQSTTEQSNGDTIMPAPLSAAALPKTNGVMTNRDVAPSQPEHHPLPAPIPAERDNEGYSVPSAATDEITRAQQEAAAVDADSPAIKLDIRDEPIQEEDGDAQSALSSVASKLRAQAQQVATPRKPTANRGRRDVRNTIFVPSPQTPEVPGTADPMVPSMPPFNITRSPPLTAEPYHGSDAQSVRSQNSLSSMANSAPIRHPEMHQPGLNASVVETVSAWFTHGQVTKAIVIGELALSHTASEGYTSKSEGIRLENFPVLEKVAPNPNFITPIPSKAGEYSVDLSQISRTTVAFKYQVHLNEGNLATHAPMMLTPSWKVEPTQTSVILNYAFNSAFASPTGRSVSMKNVTVLITLEGSKASACQSKPVGTFSKEKSLIYWKLGDITLDSYAEAPHKLLARFSTESEAKPGNVEVRWEISGDGAAGLGSGLGLSQMANPKEEGGSDPFADESTMATPAGAWKEVPVLRKVMSGNYTAS